MATKVACGWVGAVFEVTKSGGAKNKQVTRGHNIVADGWAGASNPQPHPKPLSIHNHT